MGKKQPKVRKIKGNIGRRYYYFECRQDYPESNLYLCVYMSARQRSVFPPLFLFPLAQVLISQPRDQKRSLAISQREPLIPHRSTQETTAP